MNEFILCVLLLVAIYTAINKACDYFVYRIKVEKVKKECILTREEILEVIKVLEEKKQQRRKREDPKK